MISLYRNFSVIPRLVSCGQETLFNSLIFFKWLKSVSNLSGDNLANAFTYGLTFLSTLGILPLAVVKINDEYYYQ